MNDFTMTRGERRATWALGSVFSLRMLGMFMVLPVLTTYGMSLAGASEALIGLAIGIYGMTQALFQIPFGLLSDHFFDRQPLTCTLRVQRVEERLGLVRDFHSFINDYASVKG